MALLRRLVIPALGLLLVVVGPAAQAATYSIADGAGGVRVHRAVSNVQSIDLYRTTYYADHYSFGDQAAVVWAFRRYLVYGPGRQVFRAYIRTTAGKTYVLTAQDLKGTLQVRTSTGRWVGVCAGSLETSAGTGSGPHQYDVKFPRRCLGSPAGYRVYKAWSRYYRDGRLASEDVSNPSTTPYIRW